MKVIYRVIGNIINRPSSTTPLGRWKIDYNSTIQESKIDWSNIDHCGTCSNFSEIQHKDKIARENKKKIFN